jgi:hypothetical protein
VIRRNRSNFVIIKAALDKQVNRAVGRCEKGRHEFTAAELATIDERFTEQAKLQEIAKQLTKQ